ncbi:outer membrane protein assembly factor BamE [Magnetospira thiophila]
MKIFTLTSRLLATAALSGLLVTACAPRIDTRGNLPDRERLSEVRIGEFTRDDVIDVLGSPSSTSAFGDEVWYYISKRTETTAFWAPEVKERTVVVLRFDQAGHVAELHEVTLDEGNRVILVDRVTPTAGHELTLIEQLFGNLGRFSPKK